MFISQYFVMTRGGGERGWLIGVPGPGTVQLETSIGANVVRKASYSHHQKTIILDAEGWAPAGPEGGGDAGGVMGSWGRKLAVRQG